MTHPKNNTAEKQCVRDKDNVSKVGLLLYIFWGASQRFSILINKLYIKSKCIKVYEGFRTSV